MRRFRLLLLLLVQVMLIPIKVNAAPVLEVQNSLVIPPHTVNGVKISELSGLAWDQDEQLLYAISDKGAIFHFKLDIQGKRLTAAEAVYAANLMDKDGERIKKGRRDSEGLTLMNANNGKTGDSQLVIAFEGIPRIIRFTPQGRAIKNISLPAELDDKNAYQHGNDSLESVTFHPRYGFITAPEMPLKGQPRNLHTLYSTKGQQWSFMAYPAKNSGISAMEVLPNGNLLVMERAWSGFPNPLVVSLRYLDFQQCSKDQACTLQNLKVFSNHLLVDNYEGLTHIQGNQYVMVGDDGNEDFLPTTLTLFTLDLGKR
ncbi:esterase-like activity of phytase family protein [Thiothrix subterranea]|uniref:Esterase-like activity of phytase family protein n=1 Tax=Thiothrix subterranea TaxID=2735563 RepID=A0AA51QZ86_9GAMM|nr:esterase-like activity of phytase family protein [Thiothrix subterranea]WML86752.1 esterase-like activity of phytase family protein [Thiothrix subterranea]